MKKLLYLPLMAFVMMSTGCGNNEPVNTRPIVDSPATATTPTAAALECTGCSPACNEQSYNEHAIDDDLFAAITYPLGGATPNNPKMIGVDCIQTAASAVADGACDGYVFICFDNSTILVQQQTNNYIHVGYMTKDKAKADNVVSVYPFQLLKYIADNAVGQVEFYNGKQTGVRKVNIRFTDSKGVAHHLDLSGDVPPNTQITEISCK